MANALFNAEAMVEGENLESVFSIARTDLSRKGGDPSEAVLLVQVICDETVGSNEPRQNSTLVEELAVALKDWQKHDARPRKATIIVSLWDGHFYGCMVEAGVDLTDYYA